MLRYNIGNHSCKYEYIQNNNNITICLLQSYLSSRTQYVVHNECNSSTQSIEYGLPQESILGPLLFILFIDDFSKASKLFFTILFVDDTSVFLEDKEYTKLVEILNEELNKVTIWLNANKLMINVKKNALHGLPPRKN